VIDIMIHRYSSFVFRVIQQPIWKFGLAGFTPNGFSLKQRYPDGGQPFRWVIIGFRK
jgi:hypothetical protein